jgi:ABC-type Fe3+-citrate transport system substrate-binding protein
MPRLKYSKEDVVADWKTGKYTERDLASMHKISPATAHNIVKGIEKTISKLVSKQLEINQELADHSEQEVSKFKQEVEERSKYITFFNNAALKNVSVAVKKIGDDTTQAEHRMCADTIRIGRETVLGKTPDTIINNTNAQQNQKHITYEVVR